MKKTTKLLGAVIGVLLVAALFVGAGAATTSFTPAEYSADVGGSFQLTGTTTLTGTMSFASEDEDAPTLADVEITTAGPISEAVSVPADATPGEYAYTATLGADTADFTLTVEAAPIEISVDAGEGPFYQGGSITIEFSLEEAPGEDVEIDFGEDFPEEFDFGEEVDSVTIKADETSATLEGTISEEAALKEYELPFVAPEGYSLENPKVTVEAEPEPTPEGNITIALETTPMTFDVGDEETITVTVTPSATKDVEVELLAMKTVFDYEDVANAEDLPKGVEWDIDDDGNFTATIPKATTGNVKFEITASAYDVTTAGEVIGTASVVGGDIHAAKVTGIVINPTIKIDDGSKGPILLGDSVTLKIVGTAGHTVTVKSTPADVFEKKEGVEIVNEDGTLTVTLKSEAKSETGATFTVSDDESPLASDTTTDKVVVKEISTTLSKAGKDALWNGDKKPITQALEVGQQFTITLNGGKPGKEYDLDYDKDIFSTIPADAKTIEGGETVTFIVDAVPTTTKTIQSKVEEIPYIIAVNSGSVPTTEIKVEGLDAQSFAITPTATVSATTSGLITVTFNGAAKTQYWADSFIEGPEVVKPVSGFDEHSKFENKFFTTGEDGKATLTYQALTTWVDLPFYFGQKVYDYPYTAIFDLVKYVTIQPKIEVVGTAKAGEEGMILVSGVPGDETIFALPDTESFYFPAQEGVYKAKDADGFGFRYNTFTLNEITGTKALFVKYAPSDKAYGAILPIYSYDDLVGLVELTSETIPVTLSAGDMDTVMAYIAYDKDQLPAGKYFLKDGDNVTPYYIYAYETDDGKTYLAPTALDVPGVYTNAKGDVSFIMLFPTIDTDAQVNYTESDPNFVYDLWGSTFVKNNNKAYYIDGHLNIPGVKSEDIKKDNIGLELVDETGASTIIDPTILSNGYFLIDSTAFDKQKTGEYALRPFFIDSHLLVKKTPAEFTTGDEVPFTIIKDGEVGITLSTEEAVSGTKFIGTITGMPGHWYKVNTGDGTIVNIPAQKGVELKDYITVDDKKLYYNAEFQMPAAGTFDITFKADMETGKKDTDATITVTDVSAKDKDDTEAEITVLDAIITADTDKDAYTIGEDIKVSGTNTSEDTLYFYIEGVNVGFTQIMKGTNNPVIATSEDWETTIKYDYLKTTFSQANLDAGTYTIYVSPLNGKTNDKDAVTNGVYISLPVTLKQSFITLTSVPEVVSQDSKIEISGTANAAKTVMWYLFGTNYFSAGAEKVKNDEFTITIDKEHTKSDNMAAGQYFLVVQHPMYDNNYSIAPQLNGSDNVTVPFAAWNENIAKHPKLILENDKAGVYVGNNATLEFNKYGQNIEIFDVDDRQTANAAQALCDALDSQNFDDMYAKTSFIVGAPTSIVNPIPTKVTQGEKITLSGTTTGHVGDIVSVEFLATAFAAVPKEAAGTAAFVTVTTKVQEDGTWEIVFDTSNLNCDDYTVSVAVGQLGPVTAKLTVTDKPVTPTVKPTVQPTEQPTAKPTTAAPTQTPSTPGFGILAALAGLGAVAVLLLRRQ